MSVNQLFKQSTTGVAFSLTLSSNMVEFLQEMAAGGFYYRCDSTKNALYGRGLIDFRKNSEDRTIYFLTSTGETVVSLLIDAGLIKIEELQEKWKRKETFQEEMGRHLPEDYHNKPHPAAVKGTDHE